MALQLGGQGFVAQPNERLQNLQLLAQSQGPAASQTRVVVLFGLHAGGLAEHVARIEHLEQIDGTHLPRQCQFADHRIERQGRGAMPAPRVEIH